MGVGPSWPAWRAPPVAKGGLCLSVCLSGQLLHISELDTVGAGREAKRRRKTLGAYLGLPGQLRELGQAVPEPYCLFPEEARGSPLVPGLSGATSHKGDRRGTPFPERAFSSVLGDVREGQAWASWGSLLSLLEGATGH